MLTQVHPGGGNRFISDQIRQYNTKALEHLYQKEESFVEILNRIPDGLFTTDPDFRITYFNPAAEKSRGSWPRMPWNVLQRRVQNRCAYAIAP